MSRHEPEVESHWSAVFPFTPPTPAPPRCKSCGQSWPRAGEVCDAKCAASLAEMLATFEGGSIDDRVEDAMREAAEAMDGAARWKVGRDFGRGQ